MCICVCVACNIVWFLNSDIFMLWIWVKSTECMECGCFLIIFVYFPLLCNYCPLYIAHSSCTSLFILIFIKSTVDCIAHFISLHILLLILFYLFFTYFFILFLPIFIYTLMCYVSSFILFFLHCPLSGPVLTYISLLIIPCMIVYVTNNKEPCIKQIKTPAALNCFIGWEPQLKYPVFRQH